MKLVKSTWLWWSGPLLTGLVVSALIALVLIFGPDWVPTPAPPPDLQKEMVKVMRGGVVHAQGRDNVYQLVFNAITGAQNSGILRNNGQSQHYLWVQMANAGGVCGLTGGGAIPLGMQGSYDNVNWFNMGSGLVNLVNGNGVNVAGGAFPFLRVTYPTTPVNCSATVWYTGAITPTTDLSANWLYLPVLTSGTGPTVGASFSSSVPNRAIAMYGFYAYLNVGVGPITVTVYTTSNTNCTGAPRAFLPGLILSSTAPTFLLSNSTVPYFRGNNGEPLCFDLSAGGSVVMGTTLRYE